MRSALALSLVVIGCSGSPGRGENLDAGPSTGADAGIPGDAAARDAGSTRDSGDEDAGDLDASAPDAGGDDAGSSPRKIVFATSELFDGNLGGLAGADAICQRLASDASLTGSFLAWLSDSTESPATRFARSSIPYSLVDGTVVADDWADLTDGSLANAIDLTETGSAAPAGTNAVDCVATPIVLPAHTATLQNGDRAFLGNCDDWTSSTARGLHLGDAAETAGRWTHTCYIGDDVACGRTGVLYCFEQ